MKFLTLSWLTVPLFVSMGCLIFVPDRRVHFPQSGMQTQSQTQNQTMSGQLRPNKQSPRYRLETRPSPASGWRISSINKHGDYLCNMGGADSLPDAYSSVKGKVYDLAPLLSRDGIGAAINNRGEIAGTRVTTIEKHGAMKSDEVQRSRAVIIRKGKVQDLGTLKNKDSSAVDLNDKGDVVGKAEDRTGNERAFLCHRGKVRDLGTFGGPSSEAHAINNQRQIVGDAEIARQVGVQSQVRHAFLWQAGKMHDLGTLGGKSSDATDINDRGEVVGFSWLKRKKRGREFVLRAFLYRQGKMRELPTPDGWESRALAINSSGLIVGVIYSYAKGVSYAVLWKEGQAYELNTLVPGTHRELYSAEGISERGQIFGESEKGLFLVTPLVTPKR